MIMGSQSFTDRLILYKDPYVRDVLSSILKSKDSEISPLYDGAKRTINYMVMDNIINIDAIRKMVSMDLLTVSNEKELSTCPICGSSYFNVFLLCPVHNKSVFREELVEERGTGYIGPLSNFKRGERLISPKTGKEVAAEDLISRGSWFKCSADENVVPAPKVQLVCDQGHTSDINDVDVTSEKVYRINDLYRDEVSSVLKVYELIKEKAITGGYKEERGKLKGVSGMEHSFDMIFSKEKDMYFGHVLSRWDDLFTVFAVMFDLSPSYKIRGVCVMLSGSENKSTFTLPEGLNLISAKDLADAVSKLAQLQLKLP